MQEVIIRTVTNGRPVFFWKLVSVPPRERIVWLNRWCHFLLLEMNRFLHLTVQMQPEH